MSAKRDSVGGRPLKRRVATRRPRKTLLIFCEGERTEPEYLNALKRHPAVKDVAAVDLRIDTGHGGSVPMTLVSMAIAARKKDDDEEGEIDEIWCVFDVEWPKNHPDLKEAIVRALSNGINIAISNPCFELWLILHFQDHARWSDNDAVRRLRRDLDGSRDKGLDASSYMPHVLEAAKRAAHLEQRHNRDGTFFPDDNPSSGMHRLIASLEIPSPA